MNQQHIFGFLHDPQVPIKERFIVDLGYHMQNPYVKRVLRFCLETIGLWRPTVTCQVNIYLTASDSASVYLDGR